LLRALLLVSAVGTSRDTAVNFVLSSVDELRSTDMIMLVVLCLMVNECDRRRRRHCWVGCASGITHCHALKVM